MLDLCLGPVGTVARDEYEEEINTFLVGEAIKAARHQHNLTQEQLGKRIGVQRSRVSRIEQGKGLSLPIIQRVFKALGVKQAMLDLGNFGRVALW